jgi:prepilin-type N-terminal cleavage/methylation domain-containing protein
MRTRRSSRRQGFTLLEIIVALGVLAIGATAAFSLFVAGAASGRRAEHEVNAALIAEAVIDDLRDDLTVDLDLSDYPSASAPDPNSGAAPAAAINPKTRWLAKDGTATGFDDYKYDLAITPLDGPVPDDPWQFLIEVEVRWSDQGTRRSAQYSTIMLKSVTGRELPQPDPSRRAR